MLNNSKQISNIISWIVLALIVLVWVKALMKGADSSFETGINVSSNPNKIELKSQGSIAQYHIFGSKEVLMEVPLMQSQTNLDLSLSGTMSGVDKTQGIAYIANNRGEQKKFRVGDSVFELATLKEIYKDYVVLSHNGRNESLALSENTKVTTKVNPKNMNANQSSSSVLKHLNGAQNRNWQEMIDQQKFDPTKVSAIVGNVNIVTNQMGQVQGLRVSNLADSDLLTKHGLQSNDIITAINGNKVSSANMLNIKQTLDQNPNATVTIKRNGQIQNIQINLSDL
jgi:general secretion pathway protein C